MNFVNNSYVLENQDTKDPNTTIAEGVWFKNWPSYLTRNVQPLCQPQSLPMNTQFFTNQTGLLYTITEILAGSGESTQPSLNYFHNVLQDCEIYGPITLQFDTDGPISLLTYVRGSITMQTLILCHVEDGERRRHVLLSTTFDNGPTAFAFLSNSPARPQNPEVFFWAENMITTLWATIRERLHSFGQKSNRPVTKGNLSFMLNYYQQGPPDIESLDFLITRLSIMSNGTNIVYPDLNTNRKPVSELMEWASIHFDPQALKELDAAAKLLYSIIMTDLGQLQYPHGSNLFTNTSALKNVLSAASILDDIPGLLDMTSVAAGVDDYPGPVTLTPSVISTSYCCQLPKLKSAGEILISILVADLVLLSAAWQLFTFCVGWLALDKRAKAHHCDGCLSREADSDKKLDQLPKVARVSTLSLIKSDGLSSTT